jgi:hypothetical protein
MFSSAKLLHNSNEYICVPHAAYYACMQLIMFIWYNKLGKTEADLHQLSSQDKQKSHNVLSNYAIDYIMHSSKSSAIMDSTIVRDKMVQLKSLRNNYDYKEIDVTYNDSKKATDYADDIIKTIKKYII